MLLDHRVIAIQQSNRSAGSSPSTNSKSDGMAFDSSSITRKQRPPGRSKLGLKMSNSSPSVIVGGSCDGLEASAARNFQDASTNKLPRRNNTFNVKLSDATKARCLQQLAETKQRIKRESGKECKGSDTKRSGHCTIKVKKIEKEGSSLTDQVSRSSLGKGKERRRNRKEDDGKKPVGMTGSKSADSILGRTSNHREDETALVRRRRASGSKLVTSKPLPTSSRDGEIVAQAGKTSSAYNRRLERRCSSGPALVMSPLGMPDQEKITPSAFKSSAVSTTRRTTRRRASLSTLDSSSPQNLPVQENISSPTGKSSAHTTNNATGRRASVSTSTSVTSPMNSTRSTTNREQARQTLSSQSALRSRRNRRSSQAGMGNCQIRQAVGHTADTMLMDVVGSDNGGKGKERTGKESNATKESLELTSLESLEQRSMHSIKGRKRSSAANKSQGFALASKLRQLEQKNASFDFQPGNKSVCSDSKTGSQESFSNFSYSTQDGIDQDTTNKNRQRPNDLLNKMVGIAVSPTRPDREGVLHTSHHSNGIDKLSRSSHGKWDDLDDSDRADGSGQDDYDGFA